VVCWRSGDDEGWFRRDDGFLGGGVLLLALESDVGLIEGDELGEHEGGERERRRKKSVTRRG